MTRADLEREFADATIAWAESALELSDPEIGQALGVDRKTVYRWRRHESVPAPEQRRRMEQLNHLRWLLANAFRTADIGKRWLHQSVPGLQGRTPLTVLAEGDLDSVIGVLATHVTGAHV
jgi:uncharacterized protein (DUF2384 family)